MFYRILVPLDGSALSAQILPKVEELAKTCKSETITLITTGISSTTEDSSYPGLKKYAAEIRAASEKNLTAYEAEMKAKGLNVNSVYLEGEPAQTIIAYAAENKYDLIAMASHGKGEMVWLIGSVARKVASYSTVPVLLMRVLDIGGQITRKD
jgi:nucleotide-binding universal stress UspA family protein